MLKDVKDVMHGKFSELAIRLLSAPASSASIERIFSNFGYIHNEMRNRLGCATAAKLVFCYRMLRGEKCDDFSVEDCSSQPSVETQPTADDSNSDTESVYE